MMELAYQDITNLDADDVYAYHAPEDSLDVHVHGDDGNWHRRAVGGQSMACGKPIPRGALLRYERYFKPLCPVCFTDFERTQATPHPDTQSDNHDVEK